MRGPRVARIEFAIDKIKPKLTYANDDQDFQLTPSPAPTSPFEKQAPLDYRLGY